MRRTCCVFSFSKEFFAQLCCVYIYINTVNHRLSCLFLLRMNFVKFTLFYARTYEMVHCMVKQTSKEVIWIRRRKEFGMAGFLLSIFSICSNNHIKTKSIIQTIWKEEQTGTADCSFTSNAGLKPKRRAQTIWRKERTGTADCSFISNTNLKLKRRAQMIWRKKQTDMEDYSFIDKTYIVKQENCVTNVQ